MEEDLATVRQEVNLRGYGYVKAALDRVEEVVRLAREVDTGTVPEFIKTPHAAAHARLHEALNA